MAQESTGFINLVHGLATVRRVETVHLLVGGTWNIGDNVTYAGSSTGIVVGYIPGDAESLRIVQNGTFAPIEKDDAIVNDDNAEPATSVTAVDTRVDFDAFLTPFAGKLVYLVFAGVPVYAWNGIVDTNLRKDQFVLSTPWAYTDALTTNYFDYGLHTDFTAGGRALLQTGDRSMPELINRNSLLTEQNETLPRANLRPLAQLGYVNSTWTFLEFKDVIDDPGGWAEPGGGVLVPARIKYADIDIQLVTDLAEGADHVLIRLVDASGLALASPIQVTANGMIGELTSLDNAVTPGDIIRVQVHGVTGATANVEVSSHLKVRGYYT